MNQPLLKVSSITKTFPGLRALDGVGLEVHGGEVVAVVGQNGSGKSTFVKILAGVETADSGTVEARGPDGTYLSGAAARDELHFIHQDLGLIPTLNTIENLSLGSNDGRSALLPFRTRDEVKVATRLMSEFGAHFDVTVPIVDLSPAERTIVTIARALSGWTRPDNVLVLDEPTASLHGDEVGRLFHAIRRVRDRGAGIIFISHRLDEVMDLADRVIALRDGQVVADYRSGEFDHDALIRVIAGRKLTESRIERQQPAADVVLTVEDLSGASVRAANLEVRASEVVGVTGILGSGREHLGELIFGSVPPDKGIIRLAGKMQKTGSPGRSISAGIALVPGDRKAKGAVMTMTVKENLTLAHLHPLRGRAGQLIGSAERQEVKSWIKQTALRPPDPDRQVSLLSGGNQQKVVLAKWLRIKPRVLLLDEPTQGVDVSAKAAIYELVARAADEGSAVLMLSSDTKELTMCCDRVIVMRDGVVAAELVGDEINEARLVAESLGLPHLGDESPLIPQENSTYVSR